MENCKEKSESPELLRGASAVFVLRLACDNLFATFNRL